ncbi:MAG: tRNA lysidine(34) synthetase TilS [Sedimentibacter sp.]
MYDLVKQNILEKNLIRAGDNVLIALSGGPDSVFLFYNLIKLKEELSFNLYASHINHMYRGEDAQHDEDFVKELCGKNGVRLFVRRKHAGEYAKELKVTEEEAGRILRYSFFKDNLKEIGKGKIAVAHNLNDQAETVLQRIIRGSGIDGLSAMSFQKDNLIRPMLNVPKSDVINYLLENKYEYCIDKTNLHDIYGRNKIRLNLIPYLEQNFNPNIQNTLFRMSETMERDKKIIEKYTDIIYNNVLIENTGKKIILDLNKIKAFEDGEIGRILRKSIEELKGNTINFEMKHIDYAVCFLRNGTTGKKINLSQGFTIEISYDNFIINKVVEKIVNFKYNVELNKTLSIPEVGKTLLFRVLNASEFNREDKNSLYFDYELIKGSLVVRNRLPGDSMVPCGMTGSKKIKDIFIDLKIPAEERDLKLIVADDDNILWLEGYRIHNSYKVSASTNKILNVQWRTTNE